MFSFAVRQVLWVFLVHCGLQIALALPHHPQIPHAYERVFGWDVSGAAQMYMESIFLPPVTTGPWAPSWSPDGLEIAFSMHGSLWRVPSTGGDAIQITSGPYYDSEPDWGPHGQIAFTRNTGHALEIWTVGPDGKNPRQLTNAGISVNPRWSPTGDTVLYTSSGPVEGRGFGLWAVSVGNGSISPLLADDHQNITASWAPSGDEVVFISNRHADGSATSYLSSLGTGGVWKLRIGETEPRLLLQEETLWQARPIWSRDGTKIIYSSFRAGHHQLWLLSPIRGNPIQLTFLPSEVFSPAWSPDSQQIAYIYNGSGTFTLHVISVGGGPSREVRIGTLKHRHPVGRLAVTITDAVTKQPTEVRTYLRASDGRSYAPRGSFHSVASVTDEHFFHAAGNFELELPPGPVAVKVMKGFEYLPQEKHVEIVPGETRKLEFTLERLMDMPSLGWYSGDNHIHMNYGGIFEATPRSLMLEADGEDLHVINDLVANLWTVIFDMKYFEGKLNTISKPNRLMYFNQEYRPNFAGHMSLLNLKEFIFPTFHGYEGTARSSHYPSNAYVLDDVHAQGGIGGYVHPGPRGEFPVDAALGKVDYYDVSCIWTDEYTVAEIWYRILNLGFRIPASAGTDAMTNFWRRPTIGGVRVYVQSGNPLDYENWIRGLAGGRTFVTDGPLLFLEVNGRGPGDELKFPRQGTGSIRVHAEARSIFPMHTLDIVHNGTVVHSIKPEDPHHAKFEGTLGIDESGWVAARVTGPKKLPGLMDSYVFAHTSPVYLVKDGVPQRSPEDARYFMEWIDRMVDLLQKSEAFDSAEQKESVLELWKNARAIYAQLAHK